MDARKARGQEIAAKGSIRRTPKGYIVPSQSGQGKYAVTDAETPTARCTCPDFELRGEPCKHVWAVRVVIQQTFAFDGETVTETVSITKTVERKTYAQNWPAYNHAQTNEKDQFMILLRDLCAGLPEPEQKRGRPRLSPRDAVFAAVFKVYTTVSARRSMSDLREARERGYISKLPCHNSVLNALESADLTPILRDLIVESSKPLSAVEVDFAADSSGFTTSRFHRWYDHKYGVERQEHDWVKVHIMVGVKTNVVTAIEIHGRNAADTKQLPALVATTAQNFAMAEVSADKGYASAANIETVKSAGAEPFIAFRTSDTGWSGGAWGKALGYFLYHREEWLARHHKRSNVETAFSMMKRKFGDFVRSKTDVAMTNEALCKVLAHNLVVLIHEMAELGVEPTFWACPKSAAAAQEVGG